MVEDRKQKPDKVVLKSQANFNEAEALSRMDDSASLPESSHSRRKSGMVAAKGVFRTTVRTACRNTFRTESLRP